MSWWVPKFLCFTSVFPLLFAYVTLPANKLLHISTSRPQSSYATKLQQSIPPNKQEHFATSFIAQKNHILLDKFLHPVNKNLTQAAVQFVNFCDESFNLFLSEHITAAETEEKKQELGRIRYEINIARQKKLIEADNILRGVLAAGGLKQMEAKLQFHLRRAEIDMAFMVILQLNIEDAQAAQVETAVQVMTHLRTLIVEHQDSLVSPPVRLLRRLVRTDDPFVRKQMLRQKLIYDHKPVVNFTSPTPSSSSSASSCSTASATSANTGETCDNHAHDHSHEHSHEHSHSHEPSASYEGGSEPLPTSSPQCESIVVSAVQSWGAAEVTVRELEDTIEDVLSQMCDLGGEEQVLGDLQGKCAQLRGELEEVLAEAQAPRIISPPVV